MTKHLFKPGEDNKPRGKYIEIGPHSRKATNSHCTTINPDDRLPTTSRSGNKWRKR